MTTCHASRTVSPPSNVLAFERPEHPSETSDDWALARQEDNLRDALTKVRILRRRQDASSQRWEDMLRGLFAKRDAAACRIASLTPRQRQIMELILSGHPNKTIAWEVGINQRTVESHRAAVMKKTGVTSLVALARLADAAAWNGIDEPTVQLPAQRAVVPTGSATISSRRKVIRQL